MISLFTVVSAMALGQVQATAPVPARPAPATLSLDDIIRGIEKNQEAWRKQRSWMIRYVHTRDLMEPPPGTFVLYGDNTIVNARKGPWIFVSEDMPMIDNPRGLPNLTGRKTWALWRDGEYAERDHNNLVLRDKAPGPGEGLIYEAFYYPNGLFLDLLSDAIPAPEGFWDAPEPALSLPRCLVKHRDEYRVRKELEEVDEYPCHVVERPGKDTLWIDARRGFNVRRRRVDDEPIHFESKASSLREKAPGLWLPHRTLGIQYNPESAPRPLRGKMMRIVTNTLLVARFGDVPDTLFTVPRADVERVLDLRKPKDRR